MLTEGFCQDDIEEILGTSELKVVGQITRQQLTLATMTCKSQCYEILNQLQKEILLVAILVKEESGLMYQKLCPSAQKRKSK